MLTCLVSCALFHLNTLELAPFWKIITINLHTGRCSLNFRISGHLFLYSRHALLAFCHHRKWRLKTSLPHCHLLFLYPRHVSSAFGASISSVADSGYFLTVANEKTGGFPRKNFRDHALSFCYKRNQRLFHT